jgi:hypothetical protein
MDYQTIMKLYEIWIIINLKIEELIYNFFYLFFFLIFFYSFIVKIVKIIHCPIFILKKTILA